MLPLNLITVSCKYFLLKVFLQKCLLIKGYFLILCKWDFSGRHDCTNNSTGWEKPDSQVWSLCWPLAGAFELPCSWVLPCLLLSVLGDQEPCALCLLGKLTVSFPDPDFSKSSDAGSEFSSLPVCPCPLSCRGTVHAQWATFVPVIASSPHPLPFHVSFLSTFCKAVMWEG